MISMTLFIDGHYVELSVDAEQAQKCLDVVFVKVLQRKLNRFLRSGKVITGLQTIAETLAASITSSDLDEIGIADGVEDEALALAEADILAELARSGLPPPRMIRDHALALVNTNGSYLARAKQRLLARAEVVRETLAGAKP